MRFCYVDSYVPYVPDVGSISYYRIDIFQIQIDIRWRHYLTILGMAQNIMITYFGPFNVVLNNIYFYYCTRVQQEISVNEIIFPQPIFLPFLL